VLSSDSRAFIRFREFSSTRADARPSILRKLDTSVAGIARTSFCERLLTRSKARDRTERTRVRGGKKGSEGEDDPADGGSSKSKVRGFGAKAECSHIMIQTSLRTKTHDEGELMLQPSILLWLRKPTGNSAIGCELREMRQGPSKG
jgi:hypothetical protein